MCKVSQRSTNNVVACFKCCGWGKVTQRVFKGHTTGFESESKVCPVCKGQRVLNRKVTVELFTI